jgi:hypothetical protein
MMRGDCPHDQDAATAFTGECGGGRGAPGNGEGAAEAATMHESGMKARRGGT